MLSIRSAILICSFCILPTVAQQRVVTSADYARAEKFMAYNTAPLVLHSGGRVTWLADDRFWYRTTTTAGTEFVLVDAARGTSRPAFDRVKLAAALSAAAGTGPPLLPSAIPKLYRSRSEISRTLRCQLNS